MGKRGRVFGGVLRTLIVMYLITGLLLVVLAAVMFQFDFSVKIAQIVIIAIYVISGLVGGILMGKQMKTRKFLWGLGIGASYFGILLVTSLIVNGGSITDMVQLLITFVLCSASAMIGGMIS